MDDLCFSLDVMPGALVDADGFVATGLGVGGTFYAECWTREGTLRWRDRAKNIVPNVAINDVLGVYYAQGPQTMQFFMGIVDNAGFSAFSPNDTMASHPGWGENTQTSLATRPVWTPGAPAAQSIANPTATQFPMNPPSQITIRGFFLTSDSSLGGKIGMLSATAPLQTPQPANNGDVLKVSYAINGTTS